MIGSLLLKDMASVHHMHDRLQTKTSMDQVKLMTRKWFLVHHC